MGGEEGGGEKETRRGEKSRKAALVILHESTTGSVVCEAGYASCLTNEQPQCARQVLSWSVPSAITEYHRLGAYKQQKLFLTALEAASQRSQHQHVQCLVRAPFLVHGR